MDLTKAATVDEMLDSLLEPEDDLLLQVRQASHEAGLPIIEVSAQQGRFLQLLVEMSGAKHVLEIGTLGGYSTVCLARGAGTDGSVVTLEFDPFHAEIAGKNLAAVGLDDRVRILVGPALRTLPLLADRLKHRVQEPFDFIFIDADKENNKAYLEWAIDLTRPGATIVIDNVIRDGRVLTVENKLEFIEYLGHCPFVRSSAVQTVGSKGWDGFILARRI